MWGTSLCKLSRIEEALAAIILDGMGTCLAWRDRWSCMTSQHAHWSVARQAKGLFWRLFKIWGETAHFGLNTAPGQPICPRRGPASKLLTFPTPDPTGPITLARLTPHWCYVFFELLMNCNWTVFNKSVSQSLFPAPLQDLLTLQGWDLENLQIDDLDYSAMNKIAGQLTPAKY